MTGRPGGVRVLDAVLVAVVAGLFTALGLWIAVSGGAKDGRTGIAIAAFFGLCLGVAIWILRARRARRRSLAARSVEIVGNVPFRVRAGRSALLLAIVKVNETYGHMAGDHVLKTIASVVRSRVRHGDVFARYGGEEFALLLPETPKAIAAQLAEEIRAAVADSQVIFEERVIPVTVSMGIAEVGPDLCTPHQLVKAADARLYDAKRNGRNRVAV